MQQETEDLARVRSRVGESDLLELCIVLYFEDTTVFNKLLILCRDTPKGMKSCFIQKIVPDCYLILTLSIRLLFIDRNSHIVNRYLLTTSFYAFPKESELAA